MSFSCCEPINAHPKSPYDNQGHILIVFHLHPLSQLCLVNPIWLSTVRPSCWVDGEGFHVAPWKHCALISSPCPARELKCQYTFQTFSQDPIRVSSTRSTWRRVRYYLSGRQRHHVLRSLSYDARQPNSCPGTTTSILVNAC
jgi:hypothetical protein